MGSVNKARYVIFERTYAPQKPTSNPLKWNTNIPLIGLYSRIQGQGQITTMLHNYRSRQPHRTSNGINPSSGFRDMGFVMYGPSAAWFDKFVASGQAHIGQMGK